MRANATGRIYLIAAVLLVIALVLIARLYYVQVAHGETYRAAGQAQYVHTVDDLFSRGSIFFSPRVGAPVSAATIKSGYVLAVNPTRIADPEAVYNTLAPYLNIDKDTFLIRATLPQRTYVEIEPRVPSQVASSIDTHALSGVMLHRTQWRYYPGYELAARTVGFVGYRDDELVGKYGLERYYEDVLHRNGNALSVNFFAELFSNVRDIVFDADAAKEGDIVTSIEPTVERALEHELLRVNTRWQSTLSGGIIIDPTTGDIFALGVVPTFDLNDRRGVRIEDFQNPLVENVYELGSIIKPLTVAAGIDAGAITPRSTYNDTGSVTLDTETFQNFDGKARGVVSMQEVLNQSLNTGVAHIVEQMGKDTFREYFMQFALGTETGIDLPGETFGLVENLNSPRDIEYATASFGQGIAVTPIAAVRALSALANGGTLVTPHIAQEVHYRDGTVHTVGFPEGRRVLSAQSSEAITRMLVEVVDTSLAHGTVAKEHHTIAAKTGTAQIPNLENGGYYDDRFLHSFFGYFPAYEPKFLVFLYTVEPEDVRYASETLTEPFVNLAEFLINYYEIPPDR